MSRIAKRTLVKMVERAVSHSKGWRSFRGVESQIELSVYYVWSTVNLNSVAQMTLSLADGGCRRLSYLRWELSPNNFVTRSR